MISIKFTARQLKRSLRRDPVKLDHLCMFVVIANNRLLKIMQIHQVAI